MGHGNHVPFRARFGLVFMFIHPPSQGPKTQVLDPTLTKGESWKLKRPTRSTEFEDTTSRISTERPHELCRRSASVGSILVHM